jgi:hypothetical protein
MSGMRHWVDGTLVVPDAQQQEHEVEDKGAQQVRFEAQQRMENYQRVMSGQYRTPEEWRQIQQAEDAYADRDRWRRESGERYIPPWLCR